MQTSSTLKPVVIITGASGFIGSALCMGLAKDFTVIAVDCREPNQQLRTASLQTRWYISDISDNQGISELFAKIKLDFGQIDFVIHLAAYYDFGTDWVGEYQKTNVTGTANVLNASVHEGVKRFIFASSIAAMEPTADGSYLSENSPAAGFTPYARSKSMGEHLIKESGHRIPFTILRIAGVFSDWCELPPLYSLFKLWTSAYPMGCIVPGRGESGIPFIHLFDLVGLVRKCILQDLKLGPSNIFLASQHGATLHRQLFPAIRSESRHSGKLKPIYISKKMAKTGVRLRHSIGKISGIMPYEQPWMIDYVDRSWSVDTTITRQILEWDCTPALEILNKITDIYHNLRTDPKEWHRRNKSRNERRVAYSDL